MQRLVLVETEVAEMRVLVHVERQLQSRAAEEAARGALIEVEAQSREPDGVVLLLIRQDIALPVVEAHSAQQLEADPEPVDGLQLVDKARIARAGGRWLA